MRSLLLFLAKDEIGKKKKKNGVALAGRSARSEVVDIVGNQFQRIPFLIIFDTRAGRNKPLFRVRDMQMAGVFAARTRAKRNFLLASLPEH